MTQTVSQEQFEYVPSIDLFNQLCKLLFYVLETSRFISGWVLACDSVHSWPLYSAAPLENKAVSIPLTHIKTISEQTTFDKADCFRQSKQHLKQISNSQMNDRQSRRHLRNRDIKHDIDAIYAI